MSAKTILVPSDFTKVADTAMDHAIKIAETIKATLSVLHVVSKEENKDIDSKKLDIYLERFKRNHPDIQFNPLIEVGNIFDEIGDVAKNINASLIVMGTHGMRGLQFLVGSNALRVVSHSETPFIIVQERGIREKGYNNILVPLDLHKETKQKLHVVMEMAKYFDADVHLITPKETDEYLSNQLSRNVAYAKQFLSENRVKCDATIADEDSSDFDEGVIKNAARLDADLIAIMNLGGNSLMGIFGSSFSQKIVTNEAQIPVLIMNPKNTSSSGSGIAGFGV